MLVTVLLNLFFKNKFVSLEVLHTIFVNFKLVSSAWSDLICIKLVGSDLTLNVFVVTLVPDLKKILDTQPLKLCQKLSLSLLFSF